MQLYSLVRDDLKTGDILLFSGNGFFSKVIKFATRSKWSHVGMVYKNRESGILFVYESTSISNVTNVDSGEPLNGVQLTPLSKRLRLYNGVVAVRKLENASLNDDAQAAIEQLMYEFEGKPYEEDKLELAKSALDLISIENEEDLSTLFCSELIAEVYQRIGLLDEDKPSNEYTPADFAASTKALGLISGELTEPIELK
ncbi:MAG: YiiX/YebB-like N1pC/P60 family cysteine hydrolase [Pseudomonadota bacterium]|nr:YiiX/YebB-like N1pC/P60 family cysteine hydrolase [Pseudomonadota bacterium]